MSTLTLYFCGTSCWPKESLEDGTAYGGSPTTLYGPISGYIPTKLYSLQTKNREQRAVVIPGPGEPWYGHWNKLWVPCTINTTGGHRRDVAMGESMWDLAGHAVAKAVGIPSMGRGKRVARDVSHSLAAQRIRQIGAHVLPRDSAKPPSHDCYQWSDDMLMMAHNLRDQYWPSSAITCINIVGHSRGGVAAIMCAHELNYVFPRVPVNILAIDPVPGSGSLSKEMVWLADNVRNYVGIYAADEVSGAFNAVVPQPKHLGHRINPLQRCPDPLNRHDVANYHLIYAPGRHGTLPGNGTPDGAAALPLNDNVMAVGTLVNRLTTALLRAWGTDVPLGGFSAMPVRNLAWYKTRMTAAAATYRRMRNYTYYMVKGYNVRVGSHWKERGITSWEGSSPSNWEYLEDSIGIDPLVTRGWSLKSRPAPGRVRWTALQDVPDAIFNQVAGMDPLHADWV